MAKTFKLLQVHRQNLQANPSPTSPPITPQASQNWKPSSLNALICEQMATLGDKFQMPDNLSGSGATQSQELETIDSTLQKLVDLLYILMFQHKGYPELYGPVMQLLKDYVRTLLGFDLT